MRLLNVLLLLLAGALAVFRLHAGFPDLSHASRGAVPAPAPRLPTAAAISQPASPPVLASSAARTVNPSEVFLRRIDDPAFLSRVAQLQTLAAARDYAPLLRQLHLSAADQDRLLALIAQKQIIKSRVVNEAIHQGQLGGGGVLASVAAAQSEANGQIQSLLGGDGYARYQQFEASQGVRRTVSRLSALAEASGEPLSPAAEENLIGQFALAPATGGARPDSTGSSAQVAIGLLTPPFTPPLPPNAPQLAAHLLSGGQVALLQELMASQSVEQAYRTAVIAANRR